MPLHPVTEDGCGGSNREMLGARFAKVTVLVFKLRERLGSIILRQLVMVLSSSCSKYSSLVVFGILIAVMLIRPTGIFGPRR